MRSICNPIITIRYVSELELGLQLDVTKNFDITNNLRRQCPSGYRKRYLRPEERCSDQFTIGTCKKLKTTLSINFYYYYTTLGKKYNKFN